MPITWKNIGTGGLAGSASRLMADARKAVSTPFTALENVLRDRQALEQQNRQTAIANQTQAFEDQLLGYHSADELAADIQAGKFLEQRQKLGRRIDQEAVAGLAEKRLQELQDQDWQQQQRERTQLDWDRADWRFGNEQEDRAVVEAERAEEAKLDTILRDSLSESRELLDQQAQWVSSVAENLNIPVVNGTPDFSQATEEQKAYFDQYVQDHLPANLRSDTYLDRQFNQRLLDAGIDLDSAQAQTAIQTFQDMLLGRTQLRPEDQALLDQDIALMEQRFAEEQALIEAQIEEEAKDNFFAPIVRGDAVQAGELLRNAIEHEDYDPWGFDSLTTPQLGDKIRSVMMDGIQIPGSNKTIKPHPALIDMALTEIRGKGDPEDHLIPQLKSYFSSPARLEQYERALQLEQEKRDKLTELNRSKLTQAAALELNAYRDTGDPALAVDRMLRLRRNRLAQGAQTQ